MKRKQQKFSRFVYWTPRILSLAFTAFLALFSFDVFGNNYGFWETLLAFFIHNIPVFILLIIIWISWKRELVGAIAFALAGLLYIFLLFLKPQFEWYMLSWSMIIAGPAFLIGILFFMNWYKKRK